MKTVTSSSQENTRKISKQFLFFGVILVRSPCHYYDVKKNQLCFYQRWSRGHKARGQGQGHKKNPRPRPRTAFPRTDTLEAKNRNARGQGPRTQSASALQKKKKGLHKNFSGDLQEQKKKKRSSQKFFKRSPLKNVFQKIFQALHKILTFQKILLSSSRGQANFRSRGQGLQNVSSRTPPLAFIFQKMWTHVTIVFAWSESTV